MELTRSSVQAFSLAWAEPFGRLLGAMSPCRSLRMSRKFWSLETKTQIQKALWSFVCSACWLWACPLNCLINSFFFLAIVKCSDSLRPESRTTSISISKPSARVDHSIPLTLLSGSSTAWHWLLIFFSLHCYPPQCTGSVPYVREDCHQKSFCSWTRGCSILECGLNLDFQFCLHLFSFIWNIR